MNGKELSILVAGDDRARTATLIREIQNRVDCRVVRVESAAQCVKACAGRRFDLIVALESLEDGSGLDLLDEPLLIVPIVLLCNCASADALLTAFRAGAADVLTGPLDHAYLADTIRRVVRRHREVERANRRASRLRSLSSRLIRDRRELRRRVDLICTDIVSAYQMLARKVVDQHQRDRASAGVSDFASERD